MIELLLRAATGSAASAIAAWEEWLQSANLAALDTRELRLLPAAYRNLVAAGVEEARMPDVARQMVRRTWIRTRLLMREAAQTAASLERNGIPAVLLKGAALIAGGYARAGERSMADFAGGRCDPRRVTAAGGRVAAVARRR